MVKQPSRDDETHVVRPEDRPTPTEAMPAGDAPTRAVGADEIEAQALPPDRRIGPYKVLRELGHGGMGAVYLAVRADEQYEKKVAIKVIKGGMDSAEVVRHFRRERQILAGLDHPNIARLLDGGSTDQGLPYFVMEYIEGERIDAYCDAHRLPTVERLRLFRSVCSAVQYAHGNLIVHRDIKPGNIIVTADGVPRLLDFGIAKLIDAESAPHAATATGLAMTPEYASPEQARGEPITTASDVYSLGVLLYELLTGHNPYRLKSRQPLEVLRAVCEQEAERPSTAVGRTLEMIGPDGRERLTLTAVEVSRTREGTPERLRQRLKGDLDNIAMLALRKEPQRRYASVEALSADIGRYLDGLPVAARKGTLPYRASKFVKRNRWGVAAAAAMTALAVGAALSIAAQARRVARERDRAEAVSRFLVDLFKVSDPGEARGNSITAREVLDKGAARIGGDLGQQPEIRAALMETMGNVYDSLGLYDQAVPLLREALRIRRELLGSAHADVAKSLNNLANVLWDKGDLGAAEPLYRESLELRRKLLGSESPEVAESLNNLGGVLEAKGNYEGADALFAESLAVKRKLFGADSEAVAKTLGNLAVVRWQKGDYDGAEALLRQTLGIHRKVLGDDHPDVAGTLHDLAVILDEKGDYAGAEKQYREVLALQRRLLGQQHPDVATTLCNLANTLVHNGDEPAAEPLYRESLAMQRRLLGADSADVGANLAGLGHVLSTRGELAAAEGLWRESLAVRSKRLGDDHPDTAESLAGLAEVLRRQRKLGEAESLGRRALGVRRAKLPPEHPAVAESLVELSRVLLDAGSAREAEADVREAIEIIAKGPAPARWRAAEAESVLGGCLAAEGRADEAEAILLRSRGVLAAKGGPGRWAAREAAERLARLAEARGKAAPR